VLKVGLTGGVASGKSTLARLLCDLGAAVCDADLVVRELYRSGEPGARAVDALFGPGLLTDDGGVDRAALAGLVLADPTARQRLEEAVHPLVREWLVAWIGPLEHSPDPPAVAVVEAALLVETGYHRDYHRLVVVTAPAPVRRARALASGWEPGAFERVMAAQEDDAAREKVADYVVANPGDEAALKAAAARLWEALLEDGRLLAGGHTLPPRRITF
jgi:dephospho-CoA kinase